MTTNMASIMGRVARPACIAVKPRACCMKTEIRNMVAMSVDMTKTLRSMPVANLGSFSRRRFITGAFAVSWRVMKATSVVTATNAKTQMRGSSNQ